jgi:D-glycero-D-manno-heptose 1,7-bisphosphate phosphatase
MKVLAHLRAPESRLGLAARGLARRGHPVLWRGPGGAGEPEDTASRWRERADVVVSDAADPLAPAFAGWLAGARCLVLSLSHAAVGRWGLPSRWAWHSLEPLGLVDPQEAEDFQAQPHGLELGRVGLWSDAAPPADPDPAHPDVEVLERACERAIARHRSKAYRPAVLLDRDGTLVRDDGYLSNPDKVVLFDGVAGALRSLGAAGLALVVISNQAGVGRGLFDLTRAYEVMARLRTILRAQGVELDAVYLCPHRPDEGCACRKPNTALLERAAEDLRLSLRDSVMVGDKWIDVEAGHRVGAGAVLVRTGYGAEDEKKFGPEDRPPEAVVEDFGKAAAWILSRPEKG